MTAPDQTFLNHPTRGQGELLPPLCRPVFLKKKLHFNLLSPLQKI
jgi:hypothetical protein